jgi:hypothetical protein
MPLSLTNDALLSKLRALGADGAFTPADAKALTGAEQPDAAQKKLIASALDASLFKSTADRDAALAQLGMSAADLGPPQASASTKLLGKVRGKLTELVKEEVYKPYDLRVADVALGDAVGVDLRVKAQLIDAKDPLVTEDRHRAATTQRLAAEGPVTWAIAGGGVYPHASLGGSLPVGPATTSFGFSSSAALGYSVLAPHRLSGEGAVQAARTQTVDLPFTAKKARALEPGTEVTLRGQGQVAANASVGVGYTLAQVGSLLTVGATFGGSAGVSKSLDLSLRVKRLDANRVFVALSRVEADAAQASIGAHVGVDANARAALPDLGGGLFAKAGELAADQVDKQVEKWLALDFRATHTAGRSEKELTSWVVDLSTPAGHAAYEDLMRLDVRRADALVAEGDFSVRGAKLTERVRTEGDELKATFGPVTLLRAVSSATETHGTFATSEGDISYSRAALTDAYSGILSNLWAGKRSIARELIATQRSGEAQPTYHYHVRHTIESDGNTSKADVRRFVALADMLGALSPELAARAADPKFLGSFDDTSRTIDVFVTDAGLQKVVAAGPDALMSAYAAAYERLDRPWDTKYLWGNDKTWKTTPWLNVGHPKHGEVMSLLQTQPDPFSSGEGQANQDDQAYRFITGRALASDRAAYQASRALVKLVSEVAGEPDAAARIHALAKKDAELGLDFWNALGALATVAGPGQVLVNELRIADESAKREVVFAREGALQDPRAEIDARLRAMES